MTDKPNILLLMTDQQRWDSLGCYGSDVVDTPNIDRLAEEGACFEHCYCNAPVCTPSRASIMTGKPLPGHGVYRLHDVLPPEERLFPELLREAGYRTGLFGKLHVSGRIAEAELRHPHDGFDEYEWCLEASIHLDSPHNGYGRWLRDNHPKFYEELAAKGRELHNPPREVHFTHWAAERSIDFIRRAVDDGAPFFCNVSIFDPHNPYNDYPLEYRDRVREERIPAHQRDRRRGIAKAIERERRESYFGPFDGFSDEEIKEMRRGYYASIALMDDEYGRVIETLRELGVLDNTLVIFVSDHGDMLGDHDLMVKGAFFYDAGVRVPLVMRWPSRVGFRLRPTYLVQPHQIARTILEAAGISGASGEGESLLDVALRKPADEPAGTAISLYRNTGIADSGTYWDPPIHASMIRRGRYKLSLYHGEGGGGPAGELYDMVDDPGEMHNLWELDARQSLRLDLTEQLLEWYHSAELSTVGARAADARPDRSQQLVNRAK